jgi:hypothetical protein
MDERDQEERYQEMFNIFTVLWKRIDKLERKLNGSIIMAESSTYLNDLRREAAKLNDKI